MLGTVAPRWPRAFTSIGVGAILVYLQIYTYLSGYRDGAVAAGADARLFEPNRIILEAVLSIDQALLATIGVVSVFVFFALGEVAIIVGRLTASFASFGSDATRTAKLATYSNSILLDSCDRRQGQCDLMLGLSIAFLSGTTSYFVTSIGSGTDLTSTVLGTIVGVTFSVLFFFFAKSLVFSIDTEIAEFERLQKS